MRQLLFLLPLLLCAEEGEESSPLPEKEISSQIPEERKFTLTVKEEEGQAIDEIITTLGKNSVIALGFKKSRLHALGKKIHSVGSLQFLGYIFAKESLKDYMRVIRKNSLKWNGLIDGLKPGLNRSAETECFFAELPCFCAFLNVEHPPLLKIAQERDWNAFISFLVAN